MKLPRWYWLRRLICWWKSCDISTVNGDHGCNRCWQSWRYRGVEPLGKQAAEIPPPTKTEESFPVRTIAGNVGGWASSQYTGYGIEWACKTCGKYSNHIMNGVGVCCSPELQESRRMLAESEKYKED